MLRLTESCDNGFFFLSFGFEEKKGQEICKSTFVIVTFTFYIINSKYCLWFDVVKVTVNTVGWSLVPTWFSLLLVCTSYWVRWQSWAEGLKLWISISKNSLLVLPTDPPWGVFSKMCGLGFVHFRENAASCTVVRTGGLMRFFWPTWYLQAACWWPSLQSGKQSLSTAQKYPSSICFAASFTFSFN